MNYKCDKCPKAFKSKAALYGHKRIHSNRQTREKLSKQNVKKIIEGTSPLKSWGKSGWRKSKKLNKWFNYRSGIELNVLKMLDKLDQVVDYDTEAFSIPYKMSENGMTHNYVPDVILKTNRGKTFVIEVKPKSQLNDEKNIAKWSEAKRWCWKHKARFFVITEKDYENLGEILDLLQDKDIENAQSLMEWQINKTK